MLEELLKHDNLGTRRELEFVLFQALNPIQSRKIEDIVSFSASSMFSISRSINGILALLKFLDFINTEKGSAIVNNKVLNLKKYNSVSDFSESTDLVDALINKLNEHNSLDLLFTTNNLKFSSANSQFYVKSHLIDFRLFPVRNLLISLQFFIRNNDVPDQLLIPKIFTDYFRKKITPFFESKNGKRKMTLEQLKRTIENKEKKGEEGEEFALNYELQRLKGHYYIVDVELLTDSHVNAGYDIRSFNDLDSFVNDRYIEVKSFSGEIQFYWSKNEVKLAKELKSNYFLYLVDRTRLVDPNYTPKILQDPYKKVFENPHWKKEVENWKITVDPNINN